MAQQKQIRVREWGKVKTELTAEQRERLEIIASGISPTPFWFEGSGGQTLCTRQFVGVIECEDVTRQHHARFLVGTTLVALAPRSEWVRTPC
jgi:hypothetical protein